MNTYETESFNFEIFFYNAVINRSYKRGHKSELKISIYVKMDFL